MFARRLAFAIAVLAGLIGSQAPEFAQQYRQRLGGALEELNRIVSEFDAEVRRQSLSRAEALKRLEDNSDPLARERGEDMDKAIERAARLNEQIEAVNSAGPLMRLLRRRDELRSRDCAQHARQLRASRAPVGRRSNGRRARSAVGMGDHSPRRLAVQPQLPPSRGARVIVGGERWMAPARLLGPQGHEST